MKNEAWGAWGRSGLNLWLLILALAPVQGHGMEPKTVSKLTAKSA